MIDLLDFRQYLKYFEARHCSVVTGRRRVTLSGGLQGAVQSRTMAVVCRFSRYGYMGDTRTFLSFAIVRRGYLTFCHFHGLHSTSKNVFVKSAILERGLSTSNRILYNTIQFVISIDTFEFFS